MLHLDGDMSLLHMFDGDLSSIESLDGEFGTYQKVYEADVYEGEYEVTPMIATEQILETAQKMLSQNVTVKKIPIFITMNPQGGETVYIGGDISYG